MDLEESAIKALLEEDKNLTLSNWTHHSNWFNFKQSGWRVRLLKMVGQSTTWLYFWWVGKSSSSKHGNGRPKRHKEHIQCNSRYGQAKQGAQQLRSPHKHRIFHQKCYLNKQSSHHWRPPMARKVKTYIKEVKPRAKVNKNTYINLDIQIPFSPIVSSKVHWLAPRRDLFDSLLISYRNTRLC